MLDFTVGPEDTAVARAMKLLIALKVRHSATEMRADRAGNGESLVAIMEDEDLLFDEKRWRSKGEVRGVANLERLRRLVVDTWHQEPDDSAQTYSDS